MAQGILSKDIKLSYNNGGTLAALDGLQEVPELGGEVDKVEVTTLADGARRYINGLKDYGDLAFVFLYDNTEVTSSYRILRLLQEGFEADPTLAATAWEVELPDGTTFSFDGFPTVKLDSAGINAPMTFTLNVALNSDMVVLDAGVDPVAWQTDKLYFVNDAVSHESSNYRCIEAHISDVFATDLAAEKWVLLA